MEIKIKDKDPFYEVDSHSFYIEYKRLFLSKLRTEPNSIRPSLSHQVYLPRFSAGPQRPVILLTNGHDPNTVVMPAAPEF